MAEPGNDREQLEKRAEIYRALIRHENDLTNQRTTWMLVTQGILLAAMATLLNVDRMLLTLVLSAVGYLTAMSVGQALKNSEDSRQFVKNEWEERLRRRGYTPYVDFAPLDGRNPAQNIDPKFFPWRFLPKLFKATWLVVAAYVLWTWLLTAGALERLSAVLCN
jgi:hypothetical protein